MSSSSKVINREKAVKPPPKSYAQIAAVNAAQNSLEKAWTEVTSSNRKRKGTSSNLSKVESEKRQVIFWKVWEFRCHAQLKIDFLHSLEVSNLIKILSIIYPDKLT